MTIQNHMKTLEDLKKLVEAKPGDRSKAMHQKKSAKRLSSLVTKDGAINPGVHPDEAGATEAKIDEAAPQKFNVSIKLTVVDPSKAADFLGGTVPVDGPEAGDIESWLMDLIPEIGKSGIRLDAVDAK